MSKRTEYMRETCITCGKKHAIGTGHYFTSTGAKYCSFWCTPAGVAEIAARGGK